MAKRVPAISGCGSDAWDESLDLEKSDLPQEQKNYDAPLDEGDAAFEEGGREVDENSNRVGSSAR